METNLGAKKVQPNKNISLSDKKTLMKEANMSRIVKDDYHIANRLE